MSLANKIITAQTAAIDAGAAGSVFTETQSVSVPVGSIPVPAGFWFVPATANVSVTTTGPTGATLTLLAAGQGGMVLSDGFNTQLVGTAAETVVLLGG